MKLFHDKYTISLEQVSMMLDKQDYNLAKRFPIWLPAKQVEAAYNAIMVELAVILGRHEVSQEVNQHLLRISLYNKISSILPALYHGLSVSEVPSPEMIEYFQKQYGKAPKTAKDLELILRDIEKLTKKYKELFPENKENQVQQPQKLNFEKLLLSIELSLEMPVNRMHKLYQLEQYYMATIERNKAKEKHLEKYKH